MWGPASQYIYPVSVCIYLCLSIYLSALRPSVCLSVSLPFLSLFLFPVAHFSPAIFIEGGGRFLCTGIQTLCLTRPDKKYFNNIDTGGIHNGGIHNGVFRTSYYRVHNYHYRVSRVCKTPGPRISRIVGGGPLVQSPDGDPLGTGKRDYGIGKVSYLI